MGHYRLLVVLSGKKGGMNRGYFGSVEKTHLLLLGD